MAMTLRLTPEQDARLEALAKALGVSKQKAAAMAIENFDADQVRKKLLANAMNFVMTHDKELMDRLADA